MSRRLSALGLFCLFMFGAVAAGATPIPSNTTVPADGETTTTGVVIEPAVPVTEAPPSEEQVDWTYRFLIPTLLILAAVVVVVTVVQYFVTVVRKRYRVVR